MNPPFRRTALLKLLAGGVGYAGVFYATWATGDFIVPDSNPLSLILLVAPGALAMIGALELATGRPFGEIAARWDGMSGRRQALVGGAVVLAAVVVVFGPLLLVGWLHYD